MTPLTVYLFVFVFVCVTASVCVSVCSTFTAYISVTMDWIVIEFDGSVGSYVRYEFEIS